QTAALRQEIVSIRQELHSTVNSLQSANAQNTKRIDDLEQSTTEWSPSVMTLETTVRQLQSDVCSLSWSGVEVCNLSSVEEGSLSWSGAEVCSLSSVEEGSVSCSGAREICV